MDHVGRGGHNDILRFDHTCFTRFCVSVARASGEKKKLSAYSPK